MPMPAIHGVMQTKRWRMTCRVLRASAMPSDRLAGGQSEQQQPGGVAQGRAA